MMEDSRGLVAVESLSRLESPKQPRGVTYVEAGLSDIFGYDRAGPDDCTVADRDWEDGSVCPDAHAIAKLGLAPEAPLRRRAPGNEWIIDKHRPVRNEAIVPNRDQIADERVGLNPAPLADGCSFLYLNERSDEAIISDRAVIEINGLHDSDVFAKCNVDNSD
jgi:hypothetical protein